MSDNLPTVIKVGKIHYYGSLFWLIFFLIVFFPLGILLFFTNFGVISGQNEVQIKYDGSRFWLGFWLVVLFPVAIILGVLNGFVVVTKPFLPQASFT